MRVTHWLTALSFLALLVTGVEILISHPRFYWGEAGNASGPYLFKLPIPASRGLETGYSFVLPDQNGWSRNLHFQAAWLVAFTALVYGISGLRRGHFRRNLLPARSDLSWRAMSASWKAHLRFEPSSGEGYNVLQRLAYAGVVFGLFPLMIWTGLAMAPGFTAAFPLTVTAFGGQQSARTIHFFATLALVLFVVVHVAMVWVTGFRAGLRGMTIGQSKESL
ncbi:MAG: cytochrome b/b6 domain-containing protein [Bryobacteraceae bacterium]|nr:cytochrome b/b6 domain-containing protein [Bryobacteraceae bacterium]